MVELCAYVVKLLHLLFHSQHEQEQENDPALLPRKAFSDEESGATKYLLDLIPDPPTTNASVQVTTDSFIYIYVPLLLLLLPF